MRSRKYNNFGFTLIEMLVVIAIIGILIGISYPVYDNYIKSTYENEARRMEQTINRAIMQYYALEGSYPAAPPASELLGTTKDVSKSGSPTVVSGNKMADIQKYIDSLKNRSGASANSKGWGISMTSDGWKDGGGKFDYYYASFLDGAPYVKVVSNR